ncbi:MAG: hypothetical protein A2X56_03940 [Nitrospirae bacterium GWC2_57_13]|nr:MAG: hypothetical protein A2072_00035 [Nitrospirae bacterium GWC1_57_7]OGW27385.1 MAG: hypothetical protein A2X56_03940 [Nitrospirae bacterium GWC2_57_13]OGW43800.1 MAG: hypothetical protein A2X57_00450 [Nitrospirae bacterium GWD2_57_8]HAR45873.1 hypothetical protein [Nitrospiraceae bacterium]HAS55450.1 hypothetical protein [Nitrospiraceae bacterium]
MLVGTRELKSLSFKQRIHTLPIEQSISIRFEQDLIQPNLYFFHHFRCNISFFFRGKHGK